MCKANCRTGPHPSYGACLRANAPTVIHDSQEVGSSYFLHQQNEREINEYRAARAQGIQPSGTKLFDTRYAVEAAKRSDTAVTIS
mgnify:CR=1 FL=1